MTMTSKSCNSYTGICTYLCTQLRIRLRKIFTWSTAALIRRPKNKINWNWTSFDRREGHKPIVSKRIRCTLKCRLFMENIALRKSGSDWNAGKLTKCRASPSFQIIHKIEYILEFPALSVNYSVKCII